MSRTPNIATVSLTRRRLDGDFRNARARIVIDASIENLRRDGIPKRDYELNTIKYSKGERARVKISEAIAFINAINSL